MTKTTREIEKEQNKNMFIASVTISIIIALITLLISVSIMFIYFHEALDERLADVPHKVCSNITVWEQTNCPAFPNVNYCYEKITKEECEIK